MPDNDKLINAWITNVQTHWAIIELDNMADAAPEKAWPLILNILEGDQSNEVLQSLSAGPIEDLLVSHGDDFIDRIEAEAGKNKAFKKCLGGVWKSDMDDPIWKRVEAVRGKPW